MLVSGSLPCLKWACHPRTSHSSLPRSRVRGGRSGMEGSVTGGNVDSSAAICNPYKCEWLELKVILSLHPLEHWVLFQPHGDTVGRPYVLIWVLQEKSRTPAYPTLRLFFFRFGTSNLASWEHFFRLTLGTESSTWWFIQPEAKSQCSQWMKIWHFTLLVEFLS